MLSTTVRLLTVSGRVVALAGAGLSGFSVAHWVVRWATAPSIDWNVGLMPVILPAQTLLALWLAWSAVAREGPILFRRALIAALLAFVPLYGWYFLLLWDLGPGFLLAGSAAYAASGVLLGAALLLARPRAGGGGVAARP